MVTTEINYQELFNLFINDDELRPEMNHPYKQGNRYFATDATAMVFIPCDRVELNYPEQDKPQSDKVIPRDKTMQVVISISEIESKLTPEMIDEEIDKVKKEKCSECDGEGQVEFEYYGNKRTYTIEEDCPECGGAGDLEIEYSEKTGRKIPNRNKQFFMHDVGYMYYQLERLIKAARICGVETVVKTFGTRTNASVFDLGNDITVLIMPTMIDEYIEKEIPVII